MKKLIFLVFFSSMIFSCEKNQVSTESEYIAKIVAFDPNCSVCIFEFPDDSPKVRREIGDSPQNLYIAANLTKGSYEIGQKIKVTIRKAKNEELNSCNQQSSNGYEKIIVTSFEKFSDLSVNDTVNLGYRDCLFQPENKFYICLDSVLNDSRCPNGAYCFWEGNAVARFRYEKLSGAPVFFDLNTHRQFRTDTTIDGFTFHLLSLSPAPALESTLHQEDYKAMLEVTK